MKVAIYGKQTSFSIGEIISPFLKQLNERGIEVLLEKNFLAYLGYIPDLPTKPYETFEKNEDLPNDLDLFFTFGGDGTILSAVTVLQDKNVPIVGVNTGRLGYLAGINKDDLQDYLDDILNKKFNISERSLLSVQINDEKFENNFALNEVTVLRKETTSMITIDVFIDGEFMNTFWADGLMVATPTGSTGYSLSCNGPIIAPDTENFVITPIAPHNLNVRPVIINDNVEVKLSVQSRVPEYSMTLDSRLNSLGTDQFLTIKKANFKVKIAQLENVSYLDTLRKKLYWGSDKRN